MSSVTRFLKQYDASQTYLSVPTTLTQLYEFVPSTGTTGNYPAGFVQSIAGTAVATYIVQQAATGTLIMRDMGKTITAPITNLAGVVGRYRQVQVLAARDLNATNNTFGVIGVPAGTPTYTDAYVSYYVLYIPVPIGGVLGAAPLAGVNVLTGGQL
jgi:hypothetical protein